MELRKNYLISIEKWVNGEFHVVFNDITKPAGSEAVALLVSDETAFFLSIQLQIQLSEHKKG